MGRLPRVAVLCALALPLACAPAAFAFLGIATPVEGTLRTWHGDTSTAAVDVGAGVDTTIAGIVPVADADASVQALAGRRVRATADGQGGALIVNGPVEPVGEAVPLAALGTKTVAVLLFNFSNNASQPWTPATVRGVVFDNANSVDEYYRDASYGQLALTGDVFGWYTIDATNAGCAYTTWASQARAKAAAAGVQLSDYQYTVYAFPQAASCGWSGLAYLPGTGSWINGAMTLRVVGHELGHNFGVHHASTLACTTGTFTGSCTPSEYGDPFSIMGGAQTRHHVNWHRAQLGWFADTQTVTTTGSYLLKAAELTGTPRMLRVGRGDGTYLNLELRQPWGIFDNFAVGDPAVNGVSIRIAPALTSLVQSKLVDANPGTSTFADAALGFGQSVTDPLSGVTITTTGVGPAGATVAIVFPGGDVDPPSAPGWLPATPTATYTRLNWSAASDNVGVSGYRIYRDGAQVGTTAELTYLDPDLAPLTTYQYEIRAYDAATNLGPAVAGAVTTGALGGGVAPAVPASLRATVQSGRQVRLTWKPSTDDVGVVAYEVFRNGARVGETPTTSYVDRPGRGRFTYRVRARDADGNVSTLSLPVTVTL
jgi:chitodextrinase